MCPLVCHWTIYLGTLFGLQTIDGIASSCTVNLICCATLPFFITSAIDIFGLKAILAHLAAPCCALSIYLVWMCHCFVIVKSSLCLVVAWYWWLSFDILYLSLARFNKHIHVHRKQYYLYSLLQYLPVSLETIGSKSWNHWSQSVGGSRLSNDHSQVKSDLV